MTILIYACLIFAGYDVLAAIFKIYLMKKTACIDGFMGIAKIQENNAGNKVIGAFGQEKR
jgi:hypothetical protein